MGRRWAIIINCSTLKYTPSYIFDCSFIRLCRIEMLSLSLRNCSSKNDTSQTYLLTHNVNSISQDDSSVSLPIKLKVTKTFIIICIICIIIYFIIINCSLISTIPPIYISHFGFFPAMFSYHTCRQGVC